ncbi:hypothetical protein [Cereibacter johrii]|uniref:hypothetical protein n=1 Tax=Cereibacter johrii TaxID=445629 RepID=UPI001F2BA593|nr:hypothetical protein [Cereibacter johrii]
MARQNLDDLRRARKAAADTMAAVAARIGALEAAETPDAAALEAETAAFAAAEAAFARADAAVTRAVAVEAAQAAAAQGDGAGAGSGTGAAGAEAVPAVAADPAHRGVAAGFSRDETAGHKGPCLARRLRSRSPPRPTLSCGSVRVPKTGALGLM